ncbi:MAG: hypothetical protein CVT77_18565 [Alphaproteobacteria bacterium HGW-Alphaproteobacteria-16]|nr:MAG: hypothetical protein CVT77_18565 [Alphaproteobacteria bacterium HGW-Alphaproteobacteria-16]
MIPLTLLLAAWLAFVVPLVVAAVGRHQTTTKLAALLGLAAVLTASWAVVVGVLGMLGAHQDASEWPSPLLLAAILIAGYAVIALAALQRKFR